MLKCVHANKHLIWPCIKTGALVVNSVLNCLQSGNYIGQEMSEAALLSACEALLITHL